MPDNANTSASSLYVAEPHSSKPLLPNFRRHSQGANRVQSLRTGSVRQSDALIQPSSERQVLPFETQTLGRGFVPTAYS